MLTPNVGGGLPIWLPKGTIVRETLEQFLRESSASAVLPVVTPHIGSLNLYRTSGHYPYYKGQPVPSDHDGGGRISPEADDCPHHHQVYMVKPRSYRTSPADRGVRYGLPVRAVRRAQRPDRARAFTVMIRTCTFARTSCDELVDVIDLIRGCPHLGFSNFRTRLASGPLEQGEYGGATSSGSRRSVTSRCSRRG